MYLSYLKRFLIGRPFPTSMEAHERLDKIRGLALFSSDTVSSNAYATEAIMAVLILMGSQALRLTVPIGLAIVALILMVVFSYTQTIKHYPQGGGAYMVARDNLGTFPALLAAAALLTDYTLTVSVSISAGVRAITSAFPELFGYRVAIALAAILIITWLNLRGVRESGTVFAIPTYAFVGGVFVAILIGLARMLGLFAPLVPVKEVVEPTGSFVGLALVWLVLRAFAGGTTALTGIEAVSNGVQAFKPPEAKNAIKVMLFMAIMATILFLGIITLSAHLELIPHEEESVLSQMVRHVAGTGFLYYWVQVFTALILLLAANTGYQAFPQLSSILARDSFMPRWMADRGDRLVFSSGIAVLALIGTFIIIVFRADEIAMLPLYALGVMLSFSLSQSGMFILMSKVARLKPGESLCTRTTEVHYELGTGWKRALNGTGAIVTFIVFLILLVTKFREGAWIIAFIIPLLLVMFYTIRHHYAHVAKALSLQGVEPEDITTIADVVIVPIADLHRGVLPSLTYAKRLSKDVRAVSIATSPDRKEQLLRHWNHMPDVTKDVRLVVMDYDYRNILEPLVNYIQQVSSSEFPNRLTTVVVPEFVPDHRLARFLHNRTAERLRIRLKNHKGIVIIEVPYHIG